MDQELIALAASGATTVIGLAATDAWARVKSIARRLRGHPASEPLQLMVAEVDQYRALNADALSDPKSHSRDEYVAHWQRRLQDSLEGNPEFADVLREALDELVQNRDVVGKIEMHGEAKEGGRVYQQGSGIQFNG
jgi:hypothetical protein